jgi:squalene-hopene/tetraprenyl-beta-curcumene cyclase
LPNGIEERAGVFLVSCQNASGGWSAAASAPASVEETALAIEALAGTEHGNAVDAGAQWLAERVESGAWRDAAPIGFYFARLWYYERLYPLIFTVGALGRVVRSELT